ncbi:Release factor H-coupled R [Mycena sanguinolenta]|uniref:Release factor H-coupled R n=1 Tax=Mycena sanguinolenta TaxID=230812 RepID=A0A8H6YLT8_9AGAR|nr:Release factor H-coupled R [Mycena sanguinolenta]
MQQCRHDPSTSHIHTKIRTLRGEHFRHIQNQRHVPRNFKTATHNSPTLPDLYTDAVYSNSEKPRPAPRRDTREALFVAKRVERPKVDLTVTPAWRAEALSLIVPTVAECHKVPPLTLLCLQTLMSSLGGDLTEVVQFIPPHLRLALMRWAAVHRPLSNHQLRVLCPDGPVDGELIIVGPEATVHEDQFRGPDGEECQSAEWETDDWPNPPPDTHFYSSVGSSRGVDRLQFARDTNTSRTGQYSQSCVAAQATNDLSAARVP